MNPLFDMLAALQNNAVNEQFARQFGLQSDQVTKAMEALMPAFSQGLKRNTQTPKGFADFLSALAGGSHAAFADNPMKAFTPQGIEEGNAILGHLFGSKEVSRAIARQAEAATGISQAILKQMLPALAPLILGGLFKQMTGGQMTGGQMTGGQMGAMSGAQAAQAMGSANPWGRIFEEILKGATGGATGGGAAQPKARNPLEEILEQMTGGRGMPGGQASPGGQGRARNPLEEILEQMMGGGRRQQPGSPGPSGSDNPLGDLFRDMLSGKPSTVGRAEPSAPQDDPYRDPGGGTGMGAPDESPFPDFRDGRLGGDSRSRPEDPQAQGNEESPQGSGRTLDDLFGEMFNTGRKVNKQYQDSIESIFDEFLGPRKR